MRSETEKTTVGTLLKVTDISYSAGEKKILDNISFNLFPGEIIGLTGPNGSGKTTLLRTVSGYIKPGRGRVHINGDPVNRLTDRKRASLLSYIPQERNLSFDFPVHEILRMGAYARTGGAAVYNPDTERKAMEALSKTGQMKLWDRHFNSLSGGEKQLVIFARTLVQDTPLLLMDEPTANLDMKHEKELLTLAQDLKYENRSVIISIHNLDRAAEYCDRIILLDEGVILADGVPEAVLTKKTLERAYKTELNILKDSNTGRISVSPL